ALRIGVGERHDVGRCRDRDSGGEQSGRCSSAGTVDHLNLLVGLAIAATGATGRQRKWRLVKNRRPDARPESRQITFGQGNIQTSGPEGIACTESAATPKCATTALNPKVKRRDQIAPTLRRPPTSCNS